MQRFHTELPPHHIFLFHLRKTAPARTIAVLYPLWDTDGRFCVHGIAHCSRKDQFCRKVGRAIAEGRAKQRWAQIHGVAPVHVTDPIAVTPVWFRHHLQLAREWVAMYGDNL